MAPPLKSRVATPIGNSTAERAAEAAKITRLRALRLAKEAADREAEKNMPAPVAKPRRNSPASRSVPPRQ